jgi:DNA helicase HerA-like ATPase
MNSSKHTADKSMRETPPEVLGELDEVFAQGKEELAGLDPELADAVGFSHFDTASSHDNVVTVLASRDDMHQLASQTLVRIKSREDKRVYLGVVTKGPFSEPDAVPPQSTMAIGVVVQGKKVQYTFDYHGRADVEILGEEIDGAVVPPRYRPRPKSPVYLLREDESAKVLGVLGDLRLGYVVGYENMEAKIQSHDKGGLPRHTGIVGTTGGGKSTTVASMIHKFQKSGIATVVLDVEGEYARLDEATDQQGMLDALSRLGIEPEGVADLQVHRLVGRESRARKNPHDFTLAFSSLSPHATGEILELSEAQLQRFLGAFDIAKLLLRDFRIFPSRDEEEREALEVDELTTGYPKMTLQHVLDVVNTYLYVLTTPSSGTGRKKKGDDDEDDLRPALSLYSEFRSNPSLVLQRVHAQKSSHEISWRALAARLHRLRRLGIFDVKGARQPNYLEMLKPGRVSVIDLSDTDSPQLNNLVIADLLRGLQEEQEQRYREASASNTPITPAVIVIEEAHEFLSSERIKQMPVLFEQVARIAKRGRKRWLGLVFVTQLPQHLPNEVLGLLNNFIIHKITDSAVLSRMQRTIGSIDDSLWNRVPRLAPGQALVSFSSFSRPLMLSIDPAPCKRLLVD